MLETVVNICFIFLFSIFQIFFISKYLVDVVFNLQNVRKILAEKTIIKKILTFTKTNSFKSNPEIAFNKNLYSNQVKSQLLQ